MKTVGKIEYKKIQMISPSQYNSMKHCAYKSLLAEAMNKKPLLPVSANAYYGTVLHIILEMISKGEIRNEDEFNRVFLEEIRLMEDKLIKLGYNIFVPLQMKVKDYTMKKILLKDHLLNITENALSATDVKFYSERWYISKDNLIGGKIDLVIEQNNKTEIVDFKTGAITQDVLDDEGEIYLDVKEEYKVQLKLYAYLYFEKTGKFPTELSLVDLMKQKFRIEFSEVECLTLAADAKKLLSETNRSVDLEKYGAKPSETNCKYCLYRPACSYYRDYLMSTLSANDVVGTIDSVVKYKNGNVTICLTNGANQITVSSLASELYNELVNCKGKRIMIFNLRRELRELFYSSTKTTTAYESI